MVPSVNPDGVARGKGAVGRFNANSVDLNRNWGCDWQPVSYWREARTSPGSRPYSEPETVALRSYLIALEPSAVVFYHAAGGQIFIGDCNKDGSVSLWLGDLLSAATGYPNDVVFESYPVSGTADDWLDERGIPAVTIELANSEDTDFAQNLAGLMALQCHFALSDSLSSAPDVRTLIEAQCAQFTFPVEGS